KMIAQFFPDAVDKKGNIKTKALADAVFNSKTKLSVLNSLVHPFVIRAIKQRLKKFKEKVVVLDAPLLIEADMLGIVDFLIIMNASKSAIVKRSKFTKKEIEHRSAHQMPFEEKKEHAIKKLGDKNVFVVDNSGDIKKTKEQLKAIWERIK
ncbi:MAG: dephospho-CoA kinase, partial [Candidatus Aenigmarchaeota archaeon]|nr:dephospho-CoA kinase [Candidatus Aenigmarchaeota archaeon]